ncbi:hypothetical protein COCMIDRAFT_24821 [Bipolaris oryzae ATCC 44560]|uniref:Secreted protein n=1 Tax=Bipolaris oryzae ATCC 44560 TaxID=930090 RepID=W6ZBM2_COCMI|nr:uncharacterized protein COCMIDRAFT_24821 [Bipolaris oryzae ATCC 44560]EUC47193.1 hypothetical protein COCMIDRAFT_24821 [Bipolaris oryzae ATCC 44560]
MPLELLKSLLLLLVYLSHSWWVAVLFEARIDLQHQCGFPLLNFAPHYTHPTTISHRTRQRHPHTSVSLLSYLSEMKNPSGEMHMALQPLLHLLLSRQPLRPQSFVVPIQRR